MVRTAAGAPPSQPRSHTSRAGLVSYLVAAALCYVPQLLTQPGVVSDDTKTYLYLNPGLLLRRAPSMWDPSVALGTVTHQNIGYLLPMGPFFWVFSALHVPIWVAQRLWVGSILFAAAAGVLYLCRVVGLRGPGRVVAALGYGLSPYVMQYVGRISVILLPFAGLGWLLAFGILACRHRGWTYPALFALVVTLVSGINASSIVYVGVAPLLYIPYAVVVRRELTARQAWGVVARIGLLSIGCSLWWIAALSVEGLYGVDILKYTESVQATSSASSASEVVRGLGYWYFYGGDRIGLWTQSSVQLTTRSWLLGLTYVMPVGAFLAAALVRFRDRAFFVLLVAVGLLLSVGAHPFASPTPLGALDKAFMTHTTVGLALRSTDRATPVVLLGLAVLLGSGVAAAVSRFRGVGLAAGTLVGCLVVVANAPLLAGDSVIPQFSQPARLPSYVERAAAYLNSVEPGTRVYALPGNNFAAYRFGDTVDPIWPALLDRPFATHEQFIQGSMPTANLFYALDNPLQQGTFDTAALAPIARLMSAGDVLVQYDQQYERYDTPRPSLLEHLFATVPPGLGQPISFGAPSSNVSTLAMLDETYFDTPPATPHAPITIYPVANPRPVFRAEPISDPLILAGDNVGLVEAADAGLLQANPTILFTGTLDTNGALADRLVGHPAQLVLTDTNRKQAFEWNSLAENTGYTETAGERPTAFVANDPGFDLFAGAGTASRTTSVLTGVTSVTASAYGTAFTLRSEFRPANAIDHDLATAWATEGTAETPAVGQWWQVNLRHAVSADSVTLTQPQPARNAAWLTNQWVTEATLSFDGGRPVTVALGPESRGAHGETVVFPRRSFRSLRVRIDRTNLSNGSPPPVGSSLVGFSEIGVGNLHTTQIVSAPTDLLDRFGAGSLADRLTILFMRDRVAPVPPRSDPEPTLIRQFRLPTARTFSLAGFAHLSALAPDPTIDAVLGRTNPVVVSATSSSRMPGNTSATASATLDGKARTTWMPGLGTQADVGSWLAYRFDRSVTVDQMRLQIASDAEHSIPTSVLVSAGGVSRLVRLGHIATTPRAGSLTTVNVSFPAVSGTELRVSFPHVAVRDTLSYETSLQTALPIGIAGVGIPGVPAEHLAAEVPSQCRSDLLRVDGRPVWLAVSGSAAAAEVGSALHVALCGPDRSGLRLGPGEHLLQAANGATTGLNLDLLALDSAPGGGAAPGPPATQLVAPAVAGGPPGTRAGGTSAPVVRVLSQSATEIRLAVSNAHAPFVLVAGESLNKGWQAFAGGTGLGAPVLVDGFANGWIVDAKQLAAVGKGGSFDVTIRYGPQREVDLALGISATAVLACLLIVLASAVTGLRRRRRQATVEAVSAPLDPEAGTAPPAQSAREAGTAPAAQAAATASPAPEIVSPLTPEPVSRRPFVVGAGVVLATLLAFAAGGPIIAAVTAAGVLAGLVWRRGRAVLLLGSCAVLAVAAAEEVLQEHFGRYLPGSGWSSHFSFAAELVLMAVVALAADAVLEIVRQVRRERAAEGSAGGCPPPGPGLPGQHGDP